jgi:ACS family glucarate transporter-like MFS transporter
VALLSATAMASYLSRVNISVAGALMMKEFGLTQVVMGRVFSSFGLGYALFQIPSGMLADRVGARRVLTAATMLWVVCTILLAGIGWGPLAFGAGASLAAILVVRFLLGVAEAPTFPAAAQAVALWIPPPQQGRANGLVIGAIGVGSAIAPPLVSSVMVPYGWRVALLVSALPALTVAIAWLLMRDPPGRVTRSAVPGSPKGGRLSSRSFVLLTISYSLQGYVGYIFVFWFYLYLVEVRRFDLMRSALLSSLPWVFSIVSVPVGGWISDALAAGRLGMTWGRRVVPIAGFTGSGIFLAAGAHTPNAYVAAVCMAFSTALVLCVEGPFWATLMEIAGEKAGAAGGIMNMGSNIGGLISPALTPVLAAHIGWENALHVGAAVAIAAAALWFGVSAQAPETRQSALAPGA